MVLGPFQAACFGPADSNLVLAGRGFMKMGKWICRACSALYFLCVHIYQCIYVSKFVHLFIINPHNVFTVKMSHLTILSSYVILVLYVAVRSLNVPEKSP